MYWFWAFLAGGGDEKDQIFSCSIFILKSIWDVVARLTDVIQQLCVAPGERSSCKSGKKTKPKKPGGQFSLGSGFLQWCGADTVFPVLSFQLGLEEMKEDRQNAGATVSCSGIDYCNS